MKLVVHPLVQIDVLEAMTYYERKGGTKLAADFFLEFERLKNTILDRPLSFATIDEKHRKCRFDRFPFHALFRFESDHIFILVVRHNARHQDFGLDR